jgi:hypothetical protein
MGRTAKAYLYRNQIYTIETDIPRSKGKNIASKVWDYLYPFYEEDSQGRLVWLYDGLSSGAKSVERAIYTIASDLRPSAEEKFDTVEIIEEETGETLKTLYNVDLLGILEGIKEVLKR